jgi:hypothetical protein
VALVGAVAFAPSLFLYAMSTSTVSIDLNSVSRDKISNKYDEILKQYPTLDLYDKDSHPTKFGAYLNACIFYKLLTDSDSVSITYYGDLTKPEAILLQKLAN